MDAAAESATGIASPTSIELFAETLNKNPGVLTFFLMVGVTLVSLYRMMAYVYNSRKLKIEHKALKKDYEHEKNIKDSLESELARTREVRVIDGVLFVVHDPYPQNPICPSCYADGKVIRMAGYFPPNGLGGLDAGYMCIKCKSAILGTNNTEFAKSIKRARQLLGAERNANRKADKEKSPAGS